MPTQVKEEQFELTAHSTGMVANDITYESADGGLQILYEYVVPVGSSLVFTAEDTLSAYLEDAGVPAECLAGIKVDVVIMDSAKQNMRSLLNELRYGGIKEFEDQDKLMHLDVAAGEQVIAREGERVCVRANATGAASIYTIDVDDSHFRLTCKQIRHTLFA